MGLLQEFYKPYKNATIPVMATLQELRNIRLDKLAQLKKLGIDPYPGKVKKDKNNSEILNNFKKFKDKKTTLTGRVMSWREHGALVFADLRDQSGTVQLYIKKGALAKTDAKKQTIGFKELHLLDIGDFIQATGSVTKTKTGQISLQTTQITLLTKSLRPLPEKLKDPELIFRKRYLDLVINTEHRVLFERKSKFWEANRTFMKSRGFIEVETPVLEHIPGGADARPFVTHMNSLDEEFYLRISPELYLKRLIGGGFEKVFVIGPNFRNEGLSDEHLPEFYNIEWYWAYADYKDNMKMIKEMFKYIASEVYGKTKFTKNNHTFDLSGKWEEIDYAKIIKKRFGVDIFETPDSEILEILEKAGAELPGAVTRHRLIDNLWKVIRKDISGPAFLLNEPKFMSPLAKSKRDNPRLTERFHVIIAGSELGNGYTELNDPLDQFERFSEQQKANDAGDDEAQMLDVDYVEMLEYGMPPTSGYAHGERLFWFLEGVTAREGTLFPQMRHKLDDHAYEIYALPPPKQTKDANGVDDTKEINSVNDMHTKATSQTNLDDDLSGLPTRDQAYQLLQEHVQDDYQKKHALMVATALEAYADSLNEDKNLWYITGLLHDLDYFAYPDEHPKKSLDWFSDWNYPEQLIHAVQAHAHDRLGVEPQTLLASALCAVDEMSGFLYAYSLMRPDGFVGMKPKSVEKKFKDKSFASKISREDIENGMQKFDKEFSDHVQFLIDVFNSVDFL